MQTLIRIQTADFDLQGEYRGLLARSGNTGAVAAFVGLVRDRGTEAPAGEGAPAPLKVGAQPVQDRAMTIQQQRLG